jgi:methionyl-tRNA formyltransferase
MQIDPGLDTGPMLLKTELSIGPEETAPELTARLAEVGAPLIVETLRGIERGELKPKAQEGSLATLARPLKKEDGLIDWTNTAAQIFNRIRGLQPWPGAYTSFRGKNCQIGGRPATGYTQTPSEIPPGTIRANKSEVVVECGHGLLLLDSVQLEGRKRVSGREFANGARLNPGERFGI